MFSLQLQILQQQVTDLADTQVIAEDRTTRTRTEYAVLQARYDMLEEQLREVSSISAYHLKSLLISSFFSLTDRTTCRGTPGGGTKTQSRTIGPCRT